MPRWAVAVQDKSGRVGIFWRIRRSPGNHIYLIYGAGELRDRIDGIPYDPHTSWHVDGRFHVKSHGKAWIRQNRQRLDNFQGSAFFESTSVDQCVAARLPACNRNDFDHVWILEEAALDRRPGRQMIHLDLAQPGIAAPIVGAGEKIVLRWVADDAAPSIVVSLYQFPPPPADC